MDPMGIVLIEFLIFAVFVINIIMFPIIANLQNSAPGQQLPVTSSTKLTGLVQQLPSEHQVQHPHSLHNSMLGRLDEDDDGDDQR